MHQTNNEASCLNRIKGINFIELSIYNKLKMPIDLCYNDIKVSISKYLSPIYNIKKIVLLKFSIF